MGELSCFIKILKRPWILQAAVAPVHWRRRRATWLRLSVRLKTFQAIRAGSAPYRGDTHPYTLQIRERLSVGLWRRHLNPKDSPGSGTHLETGSF